VVACALLLGAPVQSKTLTIARLMEIAPTGTTNPAPYIYDSTMYAMAGLMAIAAVSHAMVKPVDPKYYEKLPEETPKA
jgi:hypothetical protein